MENGKWRADQQRHLTIGMSVTSLHDEEEKTEKMFINDGEEVDDIIPQMNLIRNCVVEMLNNKLKIAAYISTVYHKG